VLKILFNDFQRRWVETADDTLAAVAAVGAGGRYVLGSEVQDFEFALAKMWGLGHAVGVGSGLDAIEISLRALGCGPGSKVLTTPVTAFATTLAILKLGAIPVYVDVDEFGLIDLDLCESVLRHDRGIRFFIPVHLYGHSLDMGRLRRLRSEFDLAMVEDCAQSILAGHTGTAGQAAAVSFYPTKNLGALGDGGAILTNDDQFADHARRLRHYGESAKYRHDEIGYNSRLDEMQAAILRRAHLPRLAQWTARRRQIAGAYLKGIVNPAISIPGAPAGSDSCWHLFPVLAGAGFIEHMRAREIAVEQHYPTPAMDQPVMQGIPYECFWTLERTRRLCQSEVSLPIHPYLMDEEVAAVIEACNSWRPED
jgi:dTDP-3-amino-3,4,6-trideoxy-alpha-D-glucose transaminase